MHINDVERLIEFKYIDVNKYLAFNKEIEDIIISKVKATLYEIYDPDKDL